MSVYHIVYHTQRQVIAWPWNLG